MVITLPAASSAKCQVGDFNLVVNPPSKRMGGLVLKTKAEAPFDSFEDPDIVAGPGEYEIGGVRIKGLKLEKEDSGKAIHAAYTAELDGIRLGFILDISEELTTKELDGIGNIDILFFSADTKKLKDKQVTSLIKQIDPRIIIPVDDQTVKLLQGVLGQKVNAEEKLVIKKTDLAKDEAINKLVWLKTK